MSGRRLGLIAAGALLIGAGAPVAARADYTGPGLISGTATQQFDEADGPALAEDGQWAAFQGSVGGVLGVYRRNLTTGEVDLVAGGNASSPSISADGSEVAFTSTADLVPAEEPAADRGCPEVYVADLTPPAPAYTLAAALNGTSTGITYAATADDPCSPPADGGLPIAGAQAAPGVSLSADGSEVVFTVDSPSNLGLAPAAHASVPASQVAVRDLDTDTTTLVSVTPAGAPTPSGGAFPSTASLAISGAGAEDDGGIAPSPLPPADSTAAISADGTTVAWMGTNVPAQVPSATEITPAMLQEPEVSRTDPDGQEVEPLWRRIADGPAAATVRLMAGAGLDFYDYKAYLQSNSAAVEGGTAEGNAGPGVPALSADGQTVAVTADAPLPSALPGLAILGQGGTPPILPDDAYVIRVSSGSAPQVTPLTTIPDYRSSAEDASVTAVAVSPDGDDVGLETARTEFALASPALITPPTQYDGFADTYVADLTYGTLALVTSTFDGSLPDGNSGLMSFDAADDLAAASIAGNLFYGDVNPLSPEVYLYAHIPVSTAVATGSISAPFAGTTPAPAWALSATASARRNGTVLIRASVPGAGTLRARATAQLPRHPAAAPVHAAGAAARVATPTQHPATQKQKTQKKKKNPGTPVAGRTVATAQHRVATASVIALVLHVSRRYRSLAATRAGLYASVMVSFSAAGHSRLLETVPVKFRARRPAHPTQHHRARHRSSGRSGTRR
jgi:hypothetical protein